MATELESPRHGRAHVDADALSDHETSGGAREPIDRASDEEVEIDEGGENGAEDVNMEEGGENETELDDPTPAISIPDSAENPESLNMQDGQGWWSGMEHIVGNPMDQIDTLPMDASYSPLRVPSPPGSPPIPNVDEINARIAYLQNLRLEIIFWGLNATSYRLVSKL